ncbi:transmembrane protein 6/97 [Scheffersomyces amazonensis]|uniref:transmembrane protein 6/97 n=1 Tax=Scheffersomyces amazonensis TaxID=1078765 RepID=UPI00315C5F19
MISLDTFYLAYYIIHIPITILIDSSIIVPTKYLLPVSQHILDFHISTNHDFLLVEKPLWFKISGLLELTFQLPLFFYLAWSLWNNRKSINYYVFSIIYGFNAAFTTLLCLAAVYNDGPAFGLTSPQILNLMAVYSPYLGIPLLILVESTLSLNRDFRK